MIGIQILRTSSGGAIGFRSRGHADYDDPGRDIICAAVSALELNLANSVSELTDAEFQCEIDEKNGDFLFRLKDRKDGSAVLLLDSCLLGLESVSSEYGSHYLTITDQEV